MQKPQNPKQQTPRGHAQAIAKQIAQEPFKIFEKAAEQIAGSTEQQSQQPPQGNEIAPKGPSQEEIIQKKKKDQGHIQAFQTELGEIKAIKDREEQMKAKIKLQDEQQKKQLEIKKKEESPLIESIGKVKRGVLGGVGKMMGVKRKQRSAELSKTPSN